MSQGKSMLIGMPSILSQNLGQNQFPPGQRKSFGIYVSTFAQNSSVISHVLSLVVAMFTSIVFA